MNIRLRKLLVVTSTTAALLLATLGTALPVRAGVAVVPMLDVPSYYTTNLPQSGTAYNNVLAAANAVDQPNMTCLPSLNSCSEGTNTLARAMLQHVSGQRAKVIADLQLAQSTFSTSSDSLGASRLVAPLPLAARIAGITDAEVGFSLTGFFSNVINSQVNGGRMSLDTIRDIAKVDPTNQGTIARAAVMWVAWYNNDATLKTEAYNNLVRYVGNTGTHVLCTGSADCNTKAAIEAADPTPEFVFNSVDTDWGGAYTIAPVGIAEPGGGSLVLDGAIYDVYREDPEGYPGPIDTESGRNYPWEASQGTVFGAIAATHAGYNVWDDGNEAIKRSLEWMANTPGVGASQGDDRWVPWAVSAYIVGYATEPASQSPGKSFGFTDWVYGPRTTTALTYKDWWINQSSPTTNYGTNTQTHANNTTNAKRLGFVSNQTWVSWAGNGVAQPLGGSIQYYVQDTAPNGTIDLSYIDGVCSPTLNETTSTWNNWAPANCALEGLLTGMTTSTTGWKTWTAPDGNDASALDGVIVITSSTTDNFSWRSKENSSGAYKPVITMTYGNLP